MDAYATTADLIAMGRPLTSEELTKAQELLSVAAAVIRQRAKAVHKNFDELVKADADLELIAKEVSVRAVLRALNASTTSEAATQITESAGGYSQSYSPLVPGGGLYIRKSEWKMLGLSMQRVRSVELL